MTQRPREFQPIEVALEQWRVMLSNVDAFDKNPGLLGTLFLLQHPGQRLIPLVQRSFNSIFNSYRGRDYGVNHITDSVWYQTEDPQSGGLIRAMLSFNESQTIETLEEIYKQFEIYSMYTMFDGSY